MPPLTLEPRELPDNVLLLVIHHLLHIAEKEEYCDVASQRIDRPAPPPPLPPRSPASAAYKTYNNRNAAEFQSHRLHAHPWQCAACGQRNSAMCFPRCELCDNKVGPDGQDLEQVVAEAIRAALRSMRCGILNSCFLRVCVCVSPPSRRSRFRILNIFYRFFCCSFLS